jgi:DedD protein
VNIDNNRHDPDLDEPEREISLGTATILGIFFALALICAAFFGFGYSLGRHAAPPAAPVATEPKTDATPAPKTDSVFKNFKAGSTTAKADDAAADPSESAGSPAPKPALRKPSEASPAHTVAFPVASQPSAGAADPIATSGGQFVVQISAPSRQGDADALISALNRKGYKAYIRKESQDSFFHVQVGPYATRPEAQAMVKRLDTDGYKPFIK